MSLMKTILPGQPGSIRYKNKYGEKLVCVRYKYDEDRNQRQITVELIESENKWEKNLKRIPPNKILPIEVEYHENELRRKVKSLGGKWNSKIKCWELQYKQITALKLKERILQKRRLN